jgi:hypothetical protein
MDMWSIAISCLEFVLPSSILQTRIISDGPQPPVPEEVEMPCCTHAVPPLSHSSSCGAPAQFLKFDALCSQILRFNPLLHDLMSGLLQRNPATRCSASAALQHPFFVSHSPSPVQTPSVGLQSAASDRAMRSEGGRLRSAFVASKAEGGYGMQGMLARGQSDRTAATPAEVGRLQAEIRQLLQAAGTAEVERQWLAERVHKLSGDESMYSSKRSPARSLVTLAKAAEPDASGRLAEMRQMNEVRLLRLS